MRLLNANTFKFHEFYRNPPHYVILSHTWGRDEDEVSYRDILDSTATDRLAWKQKVVPCAEMAIHDGYEYIWIDTCCIDKSSAVELAESINSMYRWYQEAQTCYVLLLDVPADDTDPNFVTSKFCHSRWFTRGWTLQELLAPYNVDFFNVGWNIIGNRDGLALLLSNSTSIDYRHLKNNASVKEASVAERMHWASRRETKRPEDRTYSLLGLFGISMPPIYGEGAEHAFQRLQELILKKLPDDSILAWGVNPLPDNGPVMDRSPSSLLAQSPSDFMFGRGLSIQRDNGSASINDRATCIVDTTTSLVRIRAHVSELKPGTGFAMLDCHRRGTYRGGTERFFVGLPIAWNPRGVSKACFRRGYGSTVFSPDNADWMEEQMTLSVNSHSTLVQPVMQSGVFQIRYSPADAKITAVCPESAWDEGANSFTFEAGPAIMAVRFSPNELYQKDYIVIIVSPMREFTTSARWLVMEDTKNTPLEMIVNCWAHFRNPARRDAFAFGDTLMREISICSSHNKLLASYSFEVQPGAPACLPHATFHSASAEMKYVKTQREILAIEMDMERLADTRDILQQKIRKMDQEPIVPGARERRAGRHRLAPPNPDLDAITPRTSNQKLAIHGDDDDDPMHQEDLFARAAHYIAQRQSRN